MTRIRSSFYNCLTGCLQINIIFSSLYILYTELKKKKQKMMTSKKEKRKQKIAPVTSLQIQGAVAEVSQTMRINYKKLHNREENIGTMIVRAGKMARHHSLLTILTLKINSPEFPSPLPPPPLVISFTVTRRIQTIYTHYFRIALVSPF